MLQRVGMEGEVVAVGEVEDADEVDRVALEDLSSAIVDAVVVDDEVGRAGILRRPAAAETEEAVEHRGRLAVVLLERGAEDAGEVADLLGDEEVVLHEALDVAQAGMRGVAEADAPSRAAGRR